MKIVDRRHPAHAWYDVDTDSKSRTPITWTADPVPSMTVDANEDEMLDSGLLDASGRPLGRLRRGPGFGIYR